MITCPNCQHQNAEAAKFCENCGYKLTRVCPNCQTVNSLSAKFCANCGFNLQAEAVEDPTLARLKKLVPKEFAERLLHSRGGKPDRERRSVTILFSDVKGSTALGEERDPEEIMEIMNGAFDVLIEPVYRYEGTLARLMGDAILAFFGAPIAHEDDPERAVLAALAIQEKMPAYAATLERTRGVKGFGVRVGINTGLVVVGEVGSDLRVEYTAMGDAINVASRLENAATPGSIVISGNTARLVKHAFELESLGGLELKGKSEPVPAFRVLGRKTVMESARGIEGLASPLVGRDRELQTLQSSIEELQQGRGQIVAVMGEAGLGKSRLIAEVKKWSLEVGSRMLEVGAQKLDSGNPPPNLQPQSSNLQWLEGRSLSYETLTPYAPFVDMLENFFRLQPEETDLDKYDAITTRLAELFPGREIEFAPFLATLMGIELIGDDLERIKYLPPPDLREKIFRATTGLFERLALSAPLVLVFEDLHWTDSNSLDLIERLMALTDHAAVMLLALFRPQRQEPSWRIHEVAQREYGHRYTAVELQPLDESNARQLVANLLEIEDLPENVRALILKKAEGNPFFVEEVIRSLLDLKLVVREDGHWRATREIENIAVPDTLAGVITARLDRLDEEAKHTIQTAAVIGREFQLDVLVAVSEARQSLDESLRNLQRRELIREKSRLPLILYLFKHALTQETAYASVLISKRRELHRRVAETLERVDPERVNDIARHFLEAQEHARALPYLIGAGERAARTYSTPEAIQYLTRAVEIAKAGDNVGLARRAYEGLGEALTFGFDIPRAFETYQEMLQVARAQNDVPMQVSALNKLANVAGMYMGQFEELEKYLVEAERLAQQHQDRAGLSESYFIRCGMCMSVGDFDHVMHYMGQAAEFGRELNVQDQIVKAMDHVARSQLLMTHFDDAWQTAQETLQLAREIGNRDVEAADLTNIALYYIRNGDLDAARQAAQEGADIAARIGSAMNHALTASIVATIDEQRGDYERALAAAQRGVQAAFPLENFMPFVLVQPLATLGRTLVEISPALADRAALQLDRARELLMNPGGMVGGGMAWLDIGFAELRLGKIDAARENFEKGLNYPTMFGNLNKPQFWIGMAFVTLAQQQVDDAAKYVADARTFVEERAMKFLYPLVAYAEANVRAAKGEHERALEEFERAESLAAEMKLRPLVVDARVGAAKILDALNRPAEAEAKRAEARAMIDEMAKLIQDEKMREVFVESASGKLRKDEMQPTKDV